MPNNRMTETARRRYNRIAPFYDFMEGMVETSRYRRWRPLLWSKVEGRKVLEVGVGTGKNFAYYPPSLEITAIDFSPKMLARARTKAERQGLTVVLKLMDVQNLEFESNVFDSVIASFVFCSVPDSVKGVREIERVLKPGGKVVLLEHMLSDNRLLAWFMNGLNFFTSPFIGPELNRKTVENMEKGGLIVERVTNLAAAGIFKLIEARKKTTQR